MSQPRKVKVIRQADQVPNGDTTPKHNLFMTKAAKHLQTRSAHPNECRKNKINKNVPKSLRYDLESALVDLRRQKRACYVGSCPTQPTASEAQCFKPQASIQPWKQTPPERPQKFHQNSETPVLLQNKYKSKPRRVSRLSQTCAIFPAPMTEPTSSIKDIHIRHLFKSIFNKVPICPPTTPIGALSEAKQIMSVASQTVPPSAEMCFSLFDNLHSFNRPRATNSRSYHKMRQKSNPSLLFQNDLIDIIGKRNDEILRGICESQHKVGYPSVVNLVSPRDRQKTNDPKKNPPWR